MTFDPSTYGTDPAEPAAPKFDPSTYGQPEAPAPVAPEVAPADDRGFFARSWDDLVNTAGEAKRNIVEAGHNIKKAVTHPAERLKEIPGELAGAAGDINHMAGNALNTASGGAYKFARDEGGAFARNIASGDPRKILFGNPDEPVAPAAIADAQWNAEHPLKAAAGSAGGMFVGAPKLLAQGADAVVSPLAAAFSKAAGAKIVSKLGAVPFAGPALATTAAAAGGAAKGIAGYELTAPALAAADAPAGHKLEAAKAAATDPAGLVLSGVAGGIPSAAKQGGAEVAKYVDKAEAAANDWIANDLVGEVKGASTPTARRQMARAADNFPELIGRDQEVRNAIADARHGDLPKIKKAVDVISARLDTTQAPKEALYQRVDAALPNKGVRVGDIVNGYQKAIDELEATGLDLDAQVAAELKGRLKKITGARDWGAGESVDPASLSDKAHEDLATLRHVRDNLATRNPAALAQVNSQIAEIEATGKKIRQFNPDHVVSTRQLRRLVTDAQKTAFEREGSINGTERYNRAMEVAAVPEKILDEHLGHAKVAVPDAVQAIEQMDADTSTLLAAKKVLVQRLDNAKLSSVTPSGTAGHAAGAVKKFLHGNAGLLALERVYHGHPVQGAAIAATASAPIIKRAVDTNIAKFAATPEGTRIIARIVHASASGGDAAAAIQRAIAAGVPPRVAQKIADISRQTFASQPADTTADASP